MPWAVSCDGVDDYINLGKLGNLGRNIGTAKISVTFKTPKNYAPGYFTSLYETLNDGSNGFNIIARLNAERYLPNPVTYAPGKTFFYIRTGPDQIIGCHINEPALYDGEYHKLTVDYTDVRNSNLKVFIDEKPVQIQHYSHKTNITSSAENIQYSLNFGANNSRGTISLFSAITIANIEITIEDQPHAKYPIDEGQGNIIHDVSGNGFHGEIVGGVWVYESGEVPVSATLCGSSSLSTRSDHIRGLSAHLSGAATATGGTPILIRGLSANLVGTGTVDARMNLIAALKAHLQGKATLKSNILVLFVPEGVYVIDADEIFAKDQPSRGQVVANYIEVWVNPLKPADTPEEVYRSKDPVTIPAGKTETVTIQFDDEPVTEPAATLEEAGADLSIVDTKYYAWGADVTIKNAGSDAQTCRIVATGKPLKVQGREVVVKKDEVSIQENGLKKYTFDNPLVQDRATAELIAEKLLSFANAKRDIVIEWRGDPALELADVVMIPEYQRKGLDQRGIFYVTKQELEFDGGLRARLEGRKM